MPDPTSPAQALRAMAWRLFEEALHKRSIARSWGRTGDWQHAADADVGADELHRAASMCTAEAKRLEATWPPKLSEEDRRAAAIAYWENCPDIGFLSETFPAFVERLRAIGLDIVRVKT